MLFTQEQIKHIANLSRLLLKEEDVNKYINDLNSIVGYIDKLNEIDNSEIMNISSENNLILPLREDEIWKEIISTREELLNCSPKNKINHSIAINNIMH
ncbi:MAG: hypothetical protein ACD_4C00135G0006 [uncultured bacterium (gcode 4)]|uniref:Asp/Glu-ADT subunit C n=1 Tax=uncultured bacterium (gcode 4) TaxID=1234023 RepID=K2FY92_9BACT|nr:MAG: hypothetical protein ACD_4C00135G0006 [uncultured bacterium (gcode 4)]